MVMRFLYVWRLISEAFYNIHDALYMSNSMAHFASAPVVFVKSLLTLKLSHLDISRWQYFFFFFGDASHEISNLIFTEK